ncbi:MAG TPA: 16S rRNA (cytidine(1402)-2'-O)-methyltransferase [Microbacteriaceae bacterium]|nr:16S rRNA (cytidine(1402)-2'-O)-methyltransferase [Microbacteriaceae bacterium]
MLILAATPIGNLGDATGRLREALRTAAVIASEDTRMTRHLMRALGIDAQPRFIALHDHNERERAAELIEFARDRDVLLVSDAGMPTVSDPGFALVRAAAEAGVAVTVLPGASAVLTALALSGLPTDRFAFEGFLPRKDGERRALLEELATERRTLVFFESPHRLADSLAELATAFGPERLAAVARELTKLHEEVVRDTLAALAERFADGTRGEIAIVVAGAPMTTADPERALTEVLARVAAGESLKDAAADVAAATGLSRKALYDAALRARPA